MEWKIYTELNESRVKLDLNLPFFQNYWWLRSACNDHYYAYSAVNFYGGVNNFHTQFNYDISPTCMI